VNLEELFPPIFMGVFSGLLLFGGIYMRVRRFRGYGLRASSAARNQDQRYSPGQEIRPAQVTLRGVIDKIRATGQMGDLAWLLLILSMLVYGAVQVPRIRYFLASGVLTVAAALWVWRAVARRA
jgi:hypothetical protein